MIVYFDQFIKPQIEINHSLSGFFLMCDVIPMQFTLAGNHLDEQKPCFWVYVSERKCQLVLLKAGSCSEDVATRGISFARW